MAVRVVIFVERAVCAVVVIYMYLGQQMSTVKCLVVMVKKADIYNMLDILLTTTHVNAQCITALPG